MMGYAAIGLHYPKTPANVGGVLRASYIYDVAMVVMSGRRFAKAPTDTLAAWRHLPLIEAASVLDHVPYDCVPVAVDLVAGATPLPAFPHPERAFYIFGPEDSTLGKEMVAACARTLYVPGKSCMNLAACVNVVLYDRMAKRGGPWPQYNAVPR